METNPQIDMTPEGLMNLLEENHELFFRYLISRGYDDEFRAWLNDTSIYRCWYSPGVIQLFRLVGDLSMDEIELPIGNFFGQNTIISQEMGIQILTALHALEPDYELKDYYDENLSQLMEQGSGLTKRVNNEDFINYAEKLIQLSRHPEEVLDLSADQIEEMKSNELQRYQNRIYNFLQGYDLEDESPKDYIFILENQPVLFMNIVNSRLYDEELRHFISTSKENPKIQEQLDCALEELFN